MLFSRRDPFPYSAEHLGRRVAWVVAQLRTVPSPGTHSSAVLFEDGLADHHDASGLRHALGRLEKDLDRSLRDQRAELKYVRIHLGRRSCTGQLTEFLRGYHGGHPL